MSAICTKNKNGLRKQLHFLNPLTPPGCKTLHYVNINLFKFICLLLELFCCRQLTWSLRSGTGTNGMVICTLPDITDILHSVPEEKVYFEMV